MDYLKNFYGPNAGYVLDLYERYKQDPSSVDAETRALFANWSPETQEPIGIGQGQATAPTALLQTAPAEFSRTQVKKIVAATTLATGIRNVDIWEHA